MQAPQAKTIVIGSVIGAACVGSISHIAQGETPPLRVVAGGFVAGVLLLALADVAPELAAGFGGLVLVGSVLRDGIPAAQRISTVL